MSEARDRFMNRFPGISVGGRIRLSAWAPDYYVEITALGNDHFLAERSWTSIDGPKEGRYVYDGDWKPWKWWAKPTEITIEVDDETTKRFKEALEKLEFRAQEQQKTIAYLDEELSTSMRRVRAHEATIAALNESKAERQAQLDWARSEIGALSSAIDELANELVGVSSLARNHKEARNIRWLKASAENKYPGGMKR